MDKYLKKNASFVLNGDNENQRNGKKTQIGSVSEIECDKGDMEKQRNELEKSIGAE